MARIDVFLGPEKAEGRHGAIKATSRFQKPPALPKKRHVIFNVLDNIKRPDCVYRALVKASILQRGLDYMADAATDRVPRACSRFDDHDVMTVLLESGRHKSVAAADVVEGSSRLEPAHEFSQAIVPMGKPVAVFFDLKAQIIRFVRIGDGRPMFRVPDTIAQFQDL